MSLHGYVGAQCVHAAAEKMRTGTLPGPDLPSRGRSRWTTWASRSIAPTPSKKVTGRTLYTDDYSFTACSTEKRCQAAVTRTRIAGIDTSRALAGRQGCPHHEDVPGDPPMVLWKTTGRRPVRPARYSAILSRWWWPRPRSRPVGSDRC
ncbi:MAG: hypothetical protein R2838_24055 [Caldilineaceae bacterium]